MHPLLLRQLRRLGMDPAASPEDARWQELLQRVSRAYEEHDQERYLLERSQDLASSEMTALYATLKAERDQLETRVQERTAALQLSQGRLGSLLSLSADWIWEQNQRLEFTFVSEGIRAAAGIAPESLLGQRRMSGSGWAAEPGALAAYESRMALRQPFRDFTYSLTLDSGDKRYLNISGEPVTDASGRFTGYRGVGRDVTQAALAEQKMQELARYDSLTGLPNRVMFLDELDRLIARARRQGQTFAVCFMDLDRFKTINDSLGHAAGDELLKVMATRLRQALRESDLVARLGGDEFVVLLEGSGHPAHLSAVAQKMLDALGEPLVLQGRPFLVTGSIGLSLFPTDGEDAATLLRHADAAMYLAKERGKNNVQFYTAELADLAARQFSLESELRLALARDELVLHYQPKIAVATGRMAGVEALVRWRHPERGLVSPADFIPLAEERGMIVAIGRWVLGQACRQMGAWRAAGLPVPRVAVNLSARQFASDSLVGDFVAALQAHDIPPRLIEVELTESVLMADPQRASQVLQQLQALGVRLAIDDFGTGYSSLSYLKRFPAQTVKIDRSFVQGLPDDADDLAITHAVIAMAHSLGLQVVAEGVETDAQLRALRGMGCDEVQGYLLGRPMTAEDLALRLLAGPLEAAAPATRGPPAQRFEDRPGAAAFKPWSASRA